MIIDLSYKIHEGMPKYPGDDDISLLEDKSYEKDGYTSYIIKSGMHLGTHIDAPMHLTNDKRFISEISLDNFYGRGVILDCRGESLVKPKKEYEELIYDKEVVIIYTGFENKYGKKEYYENHPIISLELIKLFIEKGIKMIGFDMPSPDRFPFESHKMLLKNEIFILENLCNVNKLLNVKEFNIVAFPLKIEAEGSLVRAVAILT
ncbi:MAG: cyclase family protein [Clostridium sp.]|nr:cyclase family protein [Clostridium sp.]